MDRLHAMEIFIEIGDCGSFAGASRKMNISPAAVTRAISFLESVVGAPLLNRTTRQVELTDIGRAYLNECRHIMEHVIEADAAVEKLSQTPMGSLVISAPSSIGRRYLPPVIRDLLRSFHRLQFKLVIEENPPKILGPKIDARIHIGHIKDCPLITRRIGFTRVLTCASPRYLDVHGTPSEPRELRDHILIATPANTMLNRWSFETTNTTVDVKPQLAFDDFDPAIALATLGLGVFQAYHFQVADLIKSGSLVSLFDEDGANTLPIVLLHRDGATNAAKMRLLCDAVYDAFGQVPELT